MAYLFGSKQDPAEVATKTACSKLSNNAALVVGELAREPAQGLMHVATHVQRSIPALLQTHHQLERAAAQLQAVLEGLQDAQEGILSITSPATQQDLSSLAASLNTATQTLDQHYQQLKQSADGSGSAGQPGAATGSSSKLLKLFSAGAGSSSSPAASIQGS